MSSAVIFNGDYVKSLKSKLKLGNSAFIETGSADPATLSLTSPTGSLYLRSNGSLYVKFGSNASDWAPTALSNVGGTLQNTALLDSSVYFIDNADNTKKLYFELSGITTGVSRTLTIPNINGPIALGAYNAGQVTYWSPATITTLYSAPSVTWNANVGIDTNNAYSFTFTPTSSGTISNISIKMQKNAGANTGNIRAALWTTSSGSPLALLETSSTIFDVSTIPVQGTHTFYNFAFSSTSLQSGTQYAVVIYGESISGGGNVVIQVSGTGVETRDFKFTYTSGSWGSFVTTNVSANFSVTGTVSSPILLSEAQLSPTRGGTGINNAGTLTYGSNNITFTTSATTNVTLPTSGTLATLTGSENLSSKTITSSTINSSAIGATIPSSGAFTFLSVQGTGVAGTAYTDFKQETSTPSSPSSGFARLFFTTDILNLINNAARVFSLNYASLTTNRSLTVPDRSSTIATLDGDQIFTGNIAIDVAGSIRFNELLANGTNYVALKGPSNITANVTWTLPAADGTSGQYLSTDGLGTLNWASVPLATASQNGLVSTTTQTFAGTKTFSAVSSGGYGLTSSAINAQSGSYTLQSSDNGKIITVNNGGATTVTVPAGLGLGFNCSVIQIGSGQVTISASSTTLNSSSGFKIAAQHGAVSIISYATDVYNVSGNTAV